MGNRRSSKKHLYIIVAWGSKAEPTVYRTKIELVNHFNKHNSRVVDSWFEKNWFIVIDKEIVVRIEIPKVKSKVRAKV